MWRAFWKLCKETLFPCFCVSCGREGSWWCRGCQASFSLCTEHGCPMCHAPTAQGRPCAHCYDSPLDQVRAVYDYQERSSIGVLIKLFKYHHASDIAHLWAQVPVNIAPPAQGVLVPVPLHTRRLRERGFNQAELIARSFAARWGTEVCTGGLRRTRYTAQQAKLGRTDRFRNMSGAFEWLGSTAPAHVVLVDDVYTTGATMYECARVLKAHGAQRVEAIVLARD